MDHWVAGFQGLGLALACGAVLGCLGLRGALGWILGVLAAAGGAYLFGLSLTTDFGVAEIAESGHPAWPGWLAGAVFGGFSYYVWRGIASGAKARDGQSSIGVPLLIGLFALGVGALCLLVPFVGGAMFVFTVWLWLGRRRRESRKYEGLRVLK